MDAPAGSVRLVADAGAPYLAGEVTLWRRSGEQLRHDATLGLGVHPDWQGTGLGRQLLAAALAWATGPDTGLRRISLTVLADNTRARALYASHGFEPEGQRRRAVRRPDGSWVDEVIMALMVTDRSTVEDSATG